MFARGYFYGMLCLCYLVTGVALAAGSGSKHVAPSADQVKPINVGASFPVARVQSEEGKTVKLYRTLAEKPAVVVFYRGSWCPFCMKQLASLQEIAGELEAMGVTLVAVTPDKPENIADARKKAGLTFPIFSDGELDMAKAMGVAFQLDKKTAERYKKTLKESTGHDTGQLPVPAVFLKDAEEIVRYVHVDPDYKVRLSNEELLAAVKKMIEK